MLNFERYSTDGTSSRQTFCILITLVKMPGTLSVDNINSNMRNCKYDVRGEIYLAAVKVCDP
jgi:hypothetical protein